MVGGEETIAILEALNRLFHHFFVALSAWKEQVSKQETWNIPIEKDTFYSDWKQMVPVPPSPPLLWEGI